MRKNRPLGSGTSETSRANVLFIVPPTSLNARTNLRSYSAQIEPFASQLREMGVGVYYAFSPNYAGWRTRPLRKHKDLRLWAAFRFARSLLQLFFSWPVRRPFAGSLRKEWFTARSKAVEQLCVAKKISLIAGISLSTTELSAARRLRLSTIEFQHGWYSSDVREVMFQEMQPDFYAHWFKEDQKAIRADGLEPIHVGFPMSPRNSKVQDLSRPQVALICLQYKFSDSIDKAGLCHKSLEPFLRFDWRRHGFRPVVRFHPAVQLHQQFFSWLELKYKFPHLSFSLSAAGELERLLRQSKVSISHNSSIWIESVLHGVPSVSTHPNRATESIGVDATSWVRQVYGPYEAIEFAHIDSLDRVSVGFSRPNVEPVIAALMSK